VPKQFFDLKTLGDAYDFWSDEVLEDQVVTYRDAVYYDFLGQLDSKGALVKTIMHTVGSGHKKKSFGRAFTMKFGEFIFVVAKRTDSSTMISFLNGPTDMFETSIPSHKPRQPLYEQIYSVQKSFLTDGSTPRQHLYENTPLDSSWVVPYVFPFGWFGTRQDIAKYFPRFAKYSSVFRPEITKESIPVLKQMLHDLEREIIERIEESDRQEEDDCYGSSDGYGSSEAL